MSSKRSRLRVPAPAAGWRRLALIGPGFLWMVSAAGSGELLFTPRMGSLYGYQLLWMLFVAVSLKWFINREIGRYAVCTGQNLIEGFATLPGPRHWAVWIVLVPQLFVAVTAIAGLSGSAATALRLAFGGNLSLWMVVVTVATATLVVWGQYAYVERAAALMAVSLAIASVVAAVSVGPDMGALTRGLTPTIPPGIDYSEVLPWLGFMLSGAAGLIWYSFWVVEKPYGAAAAAKGRPSETATSDEQALKGWLRVMTLDCTVAVAGTLIVTLAFLVLGAELLAPQKLVPDEDRVAEVLGRLLGEVWGPVGFWFMVIGVLVGFADTVLSDQDGHGRMFAAGLRSVAARDDKRTRWADERFLRRAIVIVLVTIMPIVLYLVVGQPVTLLKMAGAIEAAHIPVVTAAVLYLNHTRLPTSLAPSRFVSIVTALAGVFFGVFAGIYITGGL